MATEVRWRRGTTAENDAFTGAEGEITVDIDKNTIRVHDGVTQGGHPSLTEEFAHEDDITYNIPSDFPTLQDAIDQLSLHKILNNQMVILNIESGHKLESGFKIIGGDYSRVKITSEDDTVYLSSDWSGYSESEMLDSVRDDRDDVLIIGQNTVMPVLDCLIDMEGSGGNGYYLVSNGRFYITPGSGVINAGWNGIETRNSVGWMRHSVWDGAKNCGMRIQQASHIGAHGATANNCESQAGDAAVFASRTSILNVHSGEAKNSGGNAVKVHRSFINFQDGDCSSAADKGIMATRGGWIYAAWANASNCEVGGFAYFSGTLNAPGINVSNSNTHGLLAENGGRIYAPSGIHTTKCDDCNDHAISAHEGTTIIATDASIKGTGDGVTVTVAGVFSKGAYVNVCGSDISDSYGRGLLAENGGQIIANGIIANNCHDIIRCESGNITADNIEGKDAKRYAIKNNGGYVTAKNGDLSGSGQDGDWNGCKVSEGGTVNVSNTNLTSENNVDEDIVCWEGSIIHAYGATGTVSKATNEIDSDGIIFKD